jgi:tetratricopeptide (TPR) repeat protein
MGRVYAARVEGRAPGLDVGAVVALKIVHPHLLEAPGFFKRFLREAQIGKAVVHENVVRTFDADEIVAGGVHQHFLVMEYVEGRTLRALLAELERVPEELCRHIGREVAKGLAAIHAAGFVHRDLKPENVLITKDHAVKVMDLGVARLVDESLRLSQSGVFVGSVEYAAPEQFGGGAVDARADLHALGLVLYELATSRHPYKADEFRRVMRRVLDEKPRRPAEINPQLSPFFEELVLQLLAKDASKRVASAAAVARILEDSEKSTWWTDRSKAIRAETRRPLRRIRIPRETAVHGRDAELAKLRALYEKAKTAEGQVVLVEGEAGIGKSRLIDEFVGRLAQEGQDVDFLFGSYPPGGAATASGAFSTAYREHFGDDDAAIREALPATPLLVPAFVALLRGDSAPTGAEPLTKESLQTVFVHATRSIAARRPAVVLIDDLHFAPEEGRALFASLALAAAGLRVLLVGCARPGLDATWLGQLDRVGASRLPLSRLGPKDLVRLLADTLRSDHLAEELSGRIAVKSDGNPFFVFEILRGLREGQFLTRRPDGAWSTTRAIEEIQIPSSVLDLVAARVADLSEEERNALDVASCIGFEFDPSLVAAVLGIGRIPLLQRLASIEKSRRLVRSAGRRFVFDHHQVQEALYGALPQMLREEYHAAIAGAIETREDAAARDPGGIDGAVCVDLAEHLFKGAQAARALSYVDAALTHLEKGCLNDAAVRLADRALDAPALATGRRRRGLLLRKAARLNLLGRREAELAALEEALRLAEADGDAAGRARTLNALGRQFLAVSRLDDARAAFGEALEAARVGGDGLSERDAHSNLGSALLFLGRFPEAQEHLERSLALASATPDVDGDAAALVNLGAVHYSCGRFAEARGALERGIEAARGCRNRRWEANGTGNLGLVYKALGRFDEARSRFESVLALAREIGDRRSECMAMSALANVLLSLGRLAEAQALHQRRLELAGDMGDKEGRGFSLAGLGSIRRRVGDFPAARRLLAESLDVLRGCGARAPAGDVLTLLSGLASEEGDAVGAMRLADEALSLRREIGHADGVAQSLLQIGEQRRLAGDAEGAITALDEALRLAREQSFDAMTAMGLALRARLPGGDPEAAAAALGGVRAIDDSMCARFALWQATGDSALLVEAKRDLDFLVEHAPRECRESMLANVRLHREIVAACKTAGL